MRKVAVAFLMIGALVGTAGCKKLFQKRGDAGAGGFGSSGGAATAQDTADEQMSDKLDEYIKCLNTLSASIGQSRKRYYTYVPKSGPTGKETYADIYKLPAGATTNCSVGVTKARAMPPSNAALEAAGLEFSNAATGVDAMIQEADRYFEEKNFKDDKWAKGKLMHPRIVAAFDRFSKADKGLHDTLDGITKPLAQRTLQRIEREEGQTFRYWRKKSLISGRDLIEAADPAGEDDDIDLALYTAAYTEFEKGLDGLQAYGSLHKVELTNQKTAPSWPLADSHYDSFVHDGTEYKKVAKEFWRCLKEAPAKAKTPSGKLDVEKMGNCGSEPAWKAVDDVIKKYNDFIHTSNNSPFP